MNIEEVLRKELCVVLKSTTKNETLFKLIETISDNLELSREVTDDMAKNILYREQLMSTGIGLGIGIPHIRFEGVEEPIVAMGINKDGINDYESIDDEVIRIVIMIIVGKDQHKEHIRLLSLIMGLLKDESIKKELLAAGSGDEIYSIITGDKNA